MYDATFNFLLCSALIRVVKFDVKTQNYIISGVHNEGDVVGDDAVRVLEEKTLLSFLMESKNYFTKK